MNRSFSLSLIRLLFLWSLIVVALYFGKPFLVPLVLASILAMLFLPLAAKLESKGWNRVLSSLACVLILVIVIVGLASLLYWQISGLAEDLTQMEQKIRQTIQQLRQFVSSTLGISQQQQQQLIQKQQQSGGSGQMAQVVGGIMSALTGFFVNLILVLVYTFLLLFLRSHLKKFILAKFPSTPERDTEAILRDGTNVARKYVSGLAMMIAMLWVLYAIGFSVAGVKNAIFFAVLCGLLEIVPFIGNITGTGLTLIMGITQGGGSGVIIGILITYALVQFIQTYILEPLIVGSELKINPLCTILGLVAGELIWGIPGLVVVLPVLGILKVVFDRIEPLKQYGMLMGEEKKPPKKSPFKKFLSVLTPNK
jgi:predicted PurR-regulated permease PerM